MDKVDKEFEEASKHLLEYYGALVDECKDSKIVGFAVTGIEFIALSHGLFKEGN